MVATLQLIPITREECRSRFQKAGIPFDESSTATTTATSSSNAANANSGSALSSKNPDDTNIEQQYTLRPITLKLCHQSDDIIDVDDLDEDERVGVTTYSKQYEDGSVAAIVSLGRNHTTGIRLPLVSRALCDVSLTASSRGGGVGGTMREVAMVDLANVDSPAVGKAALPAAASATTASTAATTSFVGGQNESSSQSKLPSSSSSSQQFNNDNGNDNKKEQQQTAAAPAAFLSMRKPSGANKHAVHIDGKLVDKPLGREIPLKHGSIISLYGPIRFAYEVSITNTDTITGTGEGSKKCKGSSSSLSPKKRKANFNNNPQQQSISSPSPAKQQQKQQSPQSPIKPSPHQELRKRAHSLLVGECTCAMCMDILIKSTFAYPCGHAFCTKCSDEVTAAAQSTNTAWNTITTIGRTTRTTTAKQTKGTCPTCRGDVQGWMPARSFDTVVWATALQGCFERDDAEYYLERRVEAKEGVVTEEERDCVLNNVHHGNNGGGGGGNSNNQHDGTTHGSNGSQQQLQQQRMNGCYLPPDPSLLKKENPMIRTLPPLFSNNATAAFPTNHRLPPQQKKRTSEDNEVICID